jgi:tetratricopeptide (TPR) repeat protein
MMAKPMAVTLPLVLLLLDIYPLKRITLSKGTGRNFPAVLEKAPFCLLSFTSVILTMLAQHAGGAFKGLERPLYLKLANALYSPFFYLRKLLWPDVLVPFYPFPRAISALDLTHYVISGIVAVSITAGCVWLWRRGRQLFIIAWAYYLITLLPVAGIIQVGVQAAADRYTYLPGISIVLLAGMGIARLYAVAGSRKNMLIAGGVVLLIIVITFGQLTVTQIRIWRDSESLWRHVIESFPGRVHFAHLNLGNTYMRQAQYDKAAAEYEKAIAILPAYANAHNNLGNAYMRQGQYDEALAEYEKAIAINPNLAESHNNLALVYYAKRNYGLARDHLDRAMALGYKVSPQLLELMKTAQPPS